MLSSRAHAFHSGGVAECGGCHSMHAPAPGGSFLLLGTDQSSTCLGCHEHAGDTGPNGYHVSTAAADMPAGTAPLQRTPGGDFGWLKKTYSGVIRGSAFTELGERHGHNVVANDHGYLADAANTTAPGGSFPSAQLACNSCHDPHGSYRRGAGGVVTRSGASIKTSGSYNGGAANEPGTAPDGSPYAVGVYRLLAGAGYSKGGVAFQGVPPAKVPSTYNAGEATTQIRVAYGQVAASGNVTWGNWCATCHPAIHSAGNYVHPIDHTLGSVISSNYYAYVKSGDRSGVFPAGRGPYSSLVPFATDGAGNTYANLDSVSRTLAGPYSTDRVICLTCHRAHASGWEVMLRWNMEGELLTWDGTYPTVAAKPQFARGRTQQEIQAAYYDRPASHFAAYQRVLCNKCHVND